MDDLDNLKAVLRPDEVAEILRVSISTIYRLIDAGKLPAFHVGAQKRIRSKDLRTYVTTTDLREDLY